MSTVTRKALNVEYVLTIDTDDARILLALLGGTLGAASERLYDQLYDEVSKELPIERLDKDAEWAADKGVSGKFDTDEFLENE